MATHPSYRHFDHSGASGSRASRGSQLVVNAFAANPESYSGKHRAYERLLRYPDGHERRIRYVGFDEVSEGSDFRCDDPYVSFSEGHDPTRWEAESSDIAGLWNVSTEPPQQQRLQVESQPDSIEQLFERFSTPEYKRKQRELWEHVRGSYQVCDGSPWVSARPVFVLTLGQGNEETGVMYTLRTSVPSPDTEDELAKVMKRRQPDGAALISVNSIADGVLAFEDERAADEFGEMLKADGHSEVGLARCDSHELFRMVGSAGAVVVLCTAAVGKVPSPVELAVSLRGQRPVED